MLESILSLFLSVSPQVTNYENVVTTLERIEAQNKATTSIVTIGVNDQGTPIKGLKIGQGATSSLVVATHHGNEYGSTAVALGVAENIAKNPVKDQTVYIIPVLNISGYNRTSRNESGINGFIDPNRDYTGPCVSGKSFKLKSTKALADFVEQNNISISATLHTYFPAVVYPWGISTQDLVTPYEEQYKKLTEAATIESGYQTGNNTQVLYPADGTFEDYAYWKHGIWSLLFELGFSHSPDQQAIKNMIDSNVPGIRRFLELSPKEKVADHNFSGKCDFRLLRRVVLE